MKESLRLSVGDAEIKGCPQALVNIIGSKKEKYKREMEIAMVFVSRTKEQRFSVAYLETNFHSI